MPVERSAGAVIFRQTKKGREYLLLQHQDEKNTRTVRPVAGHWDFPKGHIERGEKTEDTVRREVEEETGLSRIRLIPGFKETIRYFVRPGRSPGRLGSGSHRKRAILHGVNAREKRRLKFVAFFLGHVPVRSKVKLSREHQDIAWLSYKEAYERLTYGNGKEVLEKADQFLRLLKRAFP